MKIDKKRAPITAEIHESAGHLLKRFPDLEPYLVTMSGIEQQATLQATRVEVYNAAWKQIADLVGPHPERAMLTPVDMRKKLDDIYWRMLDVDRVLAGLVA